MHVAGRQGGKKTLQLRVKNKQLDVSCGILPGIKFSRFEFQFSSGFYGVVYFQYRYSSFISNFGRAIELSLAANSIEEIFEVRLMIRFIAHSVEYVIFSRFR